jgi:hypothetical protein
LSNLTARTQSALRFVIFFAIFAVFAVQFSRLTLIW